MNFILKVIGYKNYEVLLRYTDEKGDIVKMERVVSVMARSEASAVEKAHMTYLYPDKGTMKIISINGKNIKSELGGINNGKYKRK